MNVPVYIGDGTHTGTITKDENGKVTGCLLYTSAYPSSWKKALRMTLLLSRFQYY